MAGQPSIWCSIPSYKASCRWWLGFSYWDIPSTKRLHNYGKSPCSMGKATSAMAIFNSYVRCSSLARCSGAIEVDGVDLAKWNPQVLGPSQETSGFSLSNLRHLPPSCWSLERKVDQTWSNRFSHGDEISGLEIFPRNQSQLCCCCFVFAEAKPLSKYNW